VAPRRGRRAVALPCERGRDPRADEGGDPQPPHRDLALPGRGHRRRRRDPRRGGDRARRAPQGGAPGSRPATCACRAPTSPGSAAGRAGRPTSPARCRS
jgi:hypothetical protein